MKQRQLVIIKNNNRADIKRKMMRKPNINQARKMRLKVSLMKENKSTSPSIQDWSIEAKKQKVSFSQNAAAERAIARGNESEAPFEEKIEALIEIARGTAYGAVLNHNYTYSEVEKNYPNLTTTKNWTRGLRDGLSRYTRSKNSKLKKLKKGYGVFALIESPEPPIKFKNLLTSSKKQPLKLPPVSIKSIPLERETKPQIIASPELLYEIDLLKKTVHRLENKMADSEDFKFKADSEKLRKNALEELKVRRNVLR